MLRFDANLTFLFREAPFCDRFERARAAGFTHVEFLDLFRHDQDELARAVRSSGTRIVQYNVLDGDLEAGERGFASHPDQRQRWREGLLAALEAGRRLKPRQIHSLVGLRLEQMPYQDQMAVLVENIRWALPHLESARTPLMIEPLNRWDNPGYLLQTVDAALDLLRQVGSDWVRLQFDCYHVHRTQGDAPRRLRASLPHVGHVQIADHPGRREPGTGEIDYGRIFRILESSPYSGFVGLEFAPAGDTASALSWLPKQARSQPCRAAELDL